MTRFALRLASRTEPPVFWLVRTIQSYGFWALLIPLSWCAYTLWKADREGGTPEINFPQLAFGVVCTVALLFVFSFSVLTAFNYMNSP